MRTTSVLLASVVASMSLAACGGDDGGTVTPIDASISIDAPATIDAPQANCTATTSYTAPTTFGYAEFDQDAASGVTVITAGGALNADAAFDGMQLELFNNYGPFGTTAAPGTIAAGTYDLDAVQTNYASCGLCVRMFTDIDAGTGMSTDQYFATGGSVTIDTNDNAVDGTITVTLTDVTMTHVTIDPSTFESTPVGDGCNSLITGSITGTLTAPMAKLTHGPATVRFGAASKR